MIKAGLLTICFCVWASLCAAGPKQYPAEGIVIEIDKKALSVVISCEPIPGYMDAMEMSFKVHDATVLNGLNTGATVHFTMVEDGPQVFAEHIRIVKNVSDEAEPMEAARLGFLRGALDPKVAATAVQAGQSRARLCSDRPAASFSSFVPIPRESGCADFCIFALPEPKLLLSLVE